LQCLFAPNLPVWQATCCHNAAVAQAVWVVDDDQLTRTAILAVLNELGYESRGFANAEELYTALVDGEAHPQLLVLDQRLPDEGGSTIVHSLRERPQYRDIPIIFLTAIDDEEADRLASLAPVVRKPFDVDELVTAVQAHIAPEGPQPPPWL
jgi:DNA-binding response OmpR family regulator